MWMLILTNNEKDNIFDFVDFTNTRHNFRPKIEKRTCKLRLWKHTPKVVVSVQDAANLATIYQQKNTFKQPDK